MKLPGGKFGVVVLLAGMVLFSAAPNAGAAKAKAPTVKGLLGKQFKSVSTEGTPAALDGRTIGLRFFRHATNTNQPKRATIAITGGCNALGARFRIRKGRLASQGRFTGTSMLCEPNSDPWLKNTFRKGLKARINGRRLVLSRPADGVKLVFRQAVKIGRVLEKPAIDEPEEIPLVEEPIDFGGEPATFESLDGRSFKSTRVIGHVLKEPVEITFGTGKLHRFDEAGKQVEGPMLTAYLGCNWMGGEYSIEAGLLTWFDVMQTERGCFYDQDRWFHDFLNKGVEAATNGDHLSLTNGKTQIILEQE